MTRSGILLIVIIVGALALPPSASPAQQRVRQQVPSEGPIFPSGRVLDQPFPDLVIVSLSASSAGVNCIRPFIGKTTISVKVQNNGNGSAIMPSTVPTLGRAWVGVWDLNIVPGVMFIAAGPPVQLLPGQFKVFSVDVIVKQGANQNGVAFGIGAKVDPHNLIFESNDTNNDVAGVLISNKLCQ